jgi:hypothetical protein
VIDTKIKNSLDPFLILKLEITNSNEEIQNLMDNIENILSTDEVLKFSSVLSADVSSNLDYVIINKSFLPELESMMGKCGMKYKSSNMLNEIWNSDNLDFFLDYFKVKEHPEFEFDYPDEKYDLVLEILKVVVESKYDLDDVLDKISLSGFNSLNELNLYILNK